MKTNRFLTIWACAALTAAIGFAQEPVRVRKSIDTLTQQELDDYIWALNKVRDRSNANPDDHAGYIWQAGLHDDPEIGPCEHGSDHFFAWHRAHLYYFELLLRASDPPRTANVTIPYWDWSRPPATGARYPAAFSMPGLAVDGRNT